MNIEDLRSKTDAELRYELGNMKKELFGLRFQTSAETGQNPSQIRVLRRTVARIHTLLHERENGIRGQEART